METVRQTVLMEQPEIVELFRVLERNGLQKEQKEVEFLVQYLDGMEVQFAQVLEELREVKEQLSQIQDGGMKASVLRITEQAQGKVQEVGGQLNRVRKNLIQSAGNALQTFQEKGKDALRKFVSAMKIPSALARIQEGLHGTVESMNRQADKMKVLSGELHAAGGHIKNAGRIFPGKRTGKSRNTGYRQGDHSKNSEVFSCPQRQIVQYGTDHGQSAPAFGTVCTKGGKETFGKGRTEKIKGRKTEPAAPGSCKRSYKRIRKGELRNENSEDQREMVSGRAGSMCPAFWCVSVSSDQSLCGCSESGGRVCRTDRDRGTDGGYAGERTRGRGAGSLVSLRVLCGVVFHE